MWFLLLAAEPGARLASRLGMPVSGDTLRRLIRPLPTPIANTPRVLGVDDWALRKGQTYGTILCDLEARQVLEVSAGRKQEEVVALLERLNDPDAVQAISMDMSASYRPAVQLCLPKAHIVVDHFHVIQHVMKGFKKVLQSWAHKKEGKPLLEGKQHLFLRAKEDLTEEQAQERTTHWRAPSFPGDGMAPQGGVTRLGMPRLP